MYRLLQHSSLTAIVGLALGWASSANADYEISTGIDGVTVNGSFLGSINLFKIDNTTITLTNFLLTNIRVPSSTGVLEGVALTGTPGTTSAAIEFDLAIFVTNRATDGTIQAIGSFRVLADYQLINNANTHGLFPNDIHTFGGGIIGDASFFITASFAAPAVYPGSGDPGFFGANINSTSVPEPASLIMLGLSLAGLGGVSAYGRRRLD